MTMTLTPKVKNPRQHANIFSYMTFAWFVPTFVKGFRQTLNEDDLYETLDEHKSSLLGDMLEETWEKEKAKNRPSLWKALWKVFGLSFISMGLVATSVELIFKIGQNLALARLLQYYAPNQTTITDNEAYIYGGIVVMCSFFVSIGTHLYMMGLQHLGMKVRVACCSLMYRKSLKMSKTVFGDTTVGQMVNLLSNDVNRFDFGAVFTHSLWLAPVQTCLIIYILCNEVGWTGNVGIVILALVIPLQIYFGKKTSILRLETAMKTDERVRVMNEIIGGMQVIKMYSWEKPFVKVVAAVRRLEIQKLRITAIIKSMIMAFINFLPKLGVFSSVITFVLLGNVLSPQYVFIVTSFYNMLKLSMNIYFPQGITQTAEANVSVRRIQEFLSHDEVNIVRQTKEKYKQIISEDRVADTRIGITMNQATAKWSKKLSDNTLDKITTRISNSRLVAVIGSVGSGKSSFLNVILKELPLTAGKIEINGRISYASQEPWLFIGTVKENILFGEPYNEKRYKQVVKVCALERDFSLFIHGDGTSIGENGATLSGGQRARINLARSIYKEADIYLLDDPLSAVDAHVAKQIFEDCISGFLKDKCTILVTNQLQFLKMVDDIILLSNGNVAAIGSYKKLHESGLNFLQILGDVHDEEVVEATIAKRFDYASSDGDEQKPNDNKEARSKGSVGAHVYGAFFKAGGHTCTFIFLALMLLLLQVTTSSGDYFVGFWANTEETESLRTLVNVTDNAEFIGSALSTETSMIIYSCLIAALVIVSLVCAVSCLQFCVQASKNLHNVIFSKIVTAPMKFFHDNPSGRILNRFSKDMGIIDDQLPSVLLDAVEIALIVLGIVILVGIVNQWFLIAGAVIFICFYLLRLVYLATSVDIKRLEGQTRSPVFTHMTTSLQGLTTIRALGTQEMLKTEFDNRQDLHSSAWFMFLASGHTFGFLLDSICVVYIAVVTFGFLYFRKDLTGGNVGLGMTQALAMSEILQWGMRQWCEVENLMIAIERVVEYSHIENEEDKEVRNETPPESWPEAGDVEFKNVFLKYSATDPHVLKDVVFSVSSMEKVGIVGRTGAGKSSVLAALFQLSPIEGHILIDGVDIKSIPLRNLRSKISIIPQEPMLFSDTLRKNLDPFDEHTDIDLWSALEDVELKHVVNDLPTGLLTKLSEGGSNFSVGQRQLVCLARAIVRKNKILVLDEATANVDPQTDGLIQTTIRNKFKHCTVLTIAHRLHTIIDCDKIIVLDAGTVKEFGHPYNLLQTEGMFYEMIQQTGKVMSDNLYKIAKKNYENKHEEL